MDLSVIIPVYNGADFIRESIHLVHGYLSKEMTAQFEIVVVDDGSSDNTKQVLDTLGLSNVRVISLPQNQGKFGALSAGMMAAVGRCRIFTDADIPYDLDAFKYIFQQIDERSLHLVVGDRTLLYSEYAERLSPLRALTTRLFSFFVRMFVVGGLFDTQCGLKGLRGDVASALFPLLKDKGFSGDVELLYVALKYNLEIKRIPVRLRRSATSSVSVMGHGSKMLSRILALRFTWSAGGYKSDVLSALADQRYWNSSGVSSHQDTSRRGDVPAEPIRGTSKEFPISH
jgi:dolichyl-phosphate beta-glucosyltransferase